MNGGGDTWWSTWRETEGSLILHVDLRPDPDREQQALAVLDRDEQARWKRFLAKGAQRQYALCRAALRLNLCERLGCANQTLSFGYREHGKPFAKVNGAPADVRFNVSHSGQHGLIGFTRQDEFGLDLEVRTPGRDFDGIGSTVYGPRERRALSAATGSAKAHLFYRLWGLKEALIKALGTGFSLSPARFEVPEPILDGARGAVFHFPHRPADPFWLEDLGEPRFAAAYACRMKAGDSVPRTGHPLRG